jgi:hypothetical protein
MPQPGKTFSLYIYIDIYTYVYGIETGGVDASSKCIGKFQLDLMGAGGGAAARYWSVKAVAYDNIKKRKGEQRRLLTDKHQLWNTAKLRNNKDAHY